MNQNEELKAGALFAGIGGFCIGFGRAGIKTSWAIENDLAAIKSYSNYIQGVRLIGSDIQTIKVANESLDPVDVLHAGFPCQSFSCAGERKGFEDPRGQMFFEVIRIVKEFKDRKPSVIVLENSPNIRVGNGGSWFIEIMKEIKTAGYWFRDSNCAELDTYNLTPLPQKRNRLFMVAFSIDHFRNGKFSFPNKINNEPKDLTKFIDFSSSIDDDYYYLPNDNRYYRMISKEINDKTCIYQLRKFLVRVKDPGICPTLTANMGSGGHNVPFIVDAKGLRKLTEYECLKLQGFPPDFIFPDEVSKANRYKQIGNSVSVPITELLGVAIKEKLLLERKNG